MKYLFFGLGGIGQRHLRNLYSIKKDKDVIYACRKRGNQSVLNDCLEIVGENLNEKYGIICVNSIDEALANEIDAVFICNPTSMHKTVLAQCIHNEINCFIEKPVSDSLEGLYELSNDSIQHNVTTFVGYQMRYNPCIKKTKSLLEDNSIGRVINVLAEVGENVTLWHKYEDYRKLYACRRDMGGGVILTQIHELDYLYYLFGMPESVQAYGGNLSDLDIDVEDTVEIILHVNNQQGSFYINLHEDYLQNPGTRGCKIIGTNGRIEMNLITNEIHLYDKNGLESYHKKYLFERNDLFVKEITDFLYAVNNNIQSKIPLSQGIDGLKVALAVKQSIKDGKVINLC